MLTLTPGGQGAPVADDGISLWHRVSCVTCPPTWLADVISNIALFVPFGAALVLTGMASSRAVLLGAVASLLIELLQSSGVPLGRAPALADLFSNAAGTAIGAICARTRWAWLSPADRTATKLRSGWTIACGLMLVGSAMALSPVSPARAGGAVRISALPFTPGYGWNSSEATNAVVNGIALPHRGNGPVIVEALRRDSGSVTVQVRGRDARRGTVPIVFMHDPAMTTTDPRETYAHLLLAQRGTSASLSSDLLARRWGLYSPSLLNGGAFTTGREAVSLRAAMTSAVWTLAWSAPVAAPVEQVVSLRLSPALGWTLLQGIATASAPPAPILTLLWLLAWFAPLGFWGAVGARDQLGSMISRAVLPACVLLAIGYVAARLTGTSPLSVLQSGACVLASVAGALTRGVPSLRRGRSAAGVR